ncbi:MAG TPA: flagellar biosynthetic protein FliO [Chromatiales bacterium]|nr:flagellar biosynthetic protein FliO [Thiotrichales bacterium]HIP68526.1 flagellar biosynthetic protein FliO [Chromatiales bacterium]
MNKRFFGRLLTGMCSLFLPAAVTAESTLPAASSPTAFYFVKLGLALLLVLGIFVAFAWMMRRFSGFQSSAKGDLRVITGLSLGTRERLVVVKVGKAQLLLGVTPGKISKLHVLEEDLEAEIAPTQFDFKRKLKSALGQKE